MKIVIVKCVTCAMQKEIKPGEIAKGDQPMCPKCFSPMIPVRTVSSGEGMSLICSDMPYIAWHLEAERRHKKGERQVLCEICQLWVFPYWAEDVAKHTQTGHAFKPAFISFRGKRKQT